MKGLDGIQGPIYVGTGCVFRRQAFYEYDASTLKTTPRKTCNYWPKWCYCVCCGSKKKKIKAKSSVKKKITNKDDFKKMQGLQNIEVGIKGTKCLKLAMCFIWKHSYVRPDT